MSPIEILSADCGDVLFQSLFLAGKQLAVRNQQNPAG
jgi:hypothetical protein